MRREEEMEEIEKVGLEEGERERDRLGDIVVKVRWNGVQKGEETWRE